MLKKAVNKVVIGISVSALVLTGALCAYTFHLGGKIDALGKQLAASQEQQTAEISALRGETLTSKTETLARIDALGNELRGVATEMEQSVIDASKLYQEVSQGIVRISDGEKVLGSGFAFDAEGHILTPWHVVEKQNQLYIISADGRTSPAIIAGTCEYSDIAVLKQNLPLPALTVADSTAVKIGEPVIVIGSPRISDPLGGTPLELPGTLTSGIVSQTNRFLEIVYSTKIRWIANIIQFDAAINFGNSGSPLLNSRGEVIGMVIARAEGTNLAISSNKLTRVAPSLIKRGYFDYPWLGMDITNLTPKTAKDKNLETVNGALITKVGTATPAEAAGIKANDIIVAINGTLVEEAADLTCYLGEYTSSGNEVTLTLIRNGVKIELPLKVGKR